MAAQPKKKISKVRGRTRRGHFKTTLPQLSKCPNCGTPKRSHTICPECGWYKGKKIIKTKLDERIASRLKATKPATTTKKEVAPKAEEKKTEKPAAKKTAEKKSVEKKDDSK